MASDSDTDSIYYSCDSDHSESATDVNNSRRSDGSAKRRAKKLSPSKHTKAVSKERQEADINGVYITGDVNTLPTTRRRTRSKNKQAKYLSEMKKCVDENGTIHQDARQRHMHADIGSGEIRPEPLCDSPQIDKSVTVKPQKELIDGIQSVKITNSTNISAKQTNQIQNQSKQNHRQNARAANKNLGNDGLQVKLTDKITSQNKKQNQQKNVPEMKPKGQKNQDNHKEVQNSEKKETQNEVMCSEWDISEFKSQSELKRESRQRAQQLSEMQKTQDVTEIDTNQENETNESPPTDIRERALEDSTYCITPITEKYPTKSQSQLKKESRLHSSNMQVSDNRNMQHENESNISQISQKRYAPLPRDPHDKNYNNKDRQYIEYLNRLSNLPPRLLKMRDVSQLPTDFKNNKQNKPDNTKPTVPQSQQSVIGQNPPRNKTSTTNPCDRYVASGTTTENQLNRGKSAVQSNTCEASTISQQFSTNIQRNKARNCLPTETVQTAVTIQKPNIQTNAKKGTVPKTVLHKELPPKLREIISNSSRVDNIQNTKVSDKQINPKKHRDTEKKKEEPDTLPVNKLKISETNPTPKVLQEFPYIENKRLVELKTAGIHSKMADSGTCEENHVQVARHVIDIFVQIMKTAHYRRSMQAKTPQQPCNMILQFWQSS